MPMTEEVEDPGVDVSIGKDAMLIKVDVALEAEAWEVELCAKKGYAKTVMDSRKMVDGDINNEVGKRMAACDLKQT